MTFGSLKRASTGSSLANPKALEYFKNRSELNAWILAEENGSRTHQRPSDGLPWI
jgi:hypothetical protein